MNDGAQTSTMMLAQMQITPSLPTPAEPKPAAPEPTASGSSGGLGISPSLPGFSASGVSPSLPGSGPAPAQPMPAPAGSGSHLNITITNPDKLPDLPPGQHELKLVIQDPAHQPPVDSGLGFVEIFIAIVAALLIAPFV